MKASAFLLLAAAFLAALPLGAQTVSPEEGARRYFGDPVLVDQDGREQRLFTDLLAGKTVVVLHAMFIHCETDCPLTAATLQKVQEHLGERLGRDARILSITLDPEHDTPAQLLEHARKLGSRPGWSFLTGKPETVQAVLAKLGLATPNPDKHQPLLLVGNLPTGLWKKVFPIAATDEIVAVVDSVLNDHGEGAVP